MELLKKISPLAIALALLLGTVSNASAAGSAAAASAVARATGGQVLAVKPAGGGFRVKVRIGSSVRWCRVSKQGRVNC